MNKSFLLTLVLIISFTFLFGCTNPVPVCGNGVCESDVGETPESCSADCGLPPVDMGKLSVLVIDANTGEGISNAMVTLQVRNTNLEDCGIDVSELIKFYKTDSNGMFDIKLEAGQEYVVGAEAENYDSTTHYKCISISKGTTSTLKFSLTPLPPKPMCKDVEGIRIDLGESIKVTGSGDYNGKMLTLELNDYVQTGSGADKYDWQKIYQAKWALKDGDTILKFVQKAPVYDLREEVGLEYMLQRIFHLSNCWVGGDSLPHAMIEAYPAKIQHAITKDMLPGNVIYVDGTGLYAGDILKLELDDIVVNKKTLRPTWAGKFTLKNGPYELMTVVISPVTNLQTEFGEYIETNAILQIVTQDINGNYFARVKIL